MIRSIKILSKTTGYHLSQIIVNYSVVIPKLIVRLSFLTMTNPNQLCDVLLYVCSKMADDTNLSSKWPVEQERSEEKSSFGDALALAFRCARFCSASLILFASYSPVPLLMRPRHIDWSCAICSHDSVCMWKFLRETLRVTMYRFFSSPWERLPTCSSP